MSSARSTCGAAPSCAANRSLAAATSGFRLTIRLRRPPQLAQVALVIPGRREAASLEPSKEPDTSRPVVGSGLAFGASERPAGTFPLPLRALPGRHLLRL